MTFRTHLSPLLALIADDIRTQMAIIRTIAQHENLSQTDFPPSSIRECVD